MKIYPPFPTCREATPTRRAEKLIYEALEASELDGLALYELKPLSSAPQLDFAVWLLDVGTFGILALGNPVQSRPGTAASDSTPSLTAPVRN